MLIVILLCVVLVMGLKLGSASHQISKLAKDLKFDERKETRLEGRLTVLDKQLKNVEKEEKVIATKEKHAEEHLKEIEKREKRNDKQT